LDLNRNGTIENTPNAEGLIEANIPWCYEYGELEWMRPYLVTEEENRAATKVDYENRARLVVSNRVSCD